MIQVEVSPDVEQRLTDAARARGLAPEAYAEQILSSAVSLTAHKYPTNEQMEEFFKRMSTHAEKLPALSTDAYSRESIYQDHD